MTDRKAALAARLQKSSVRPELMPVTLSNGDEFLLRRLNNDETMRVATASGDGPDRQARFFVNSFRFALVDDAGDPMLESFEQAADFVNSFDLEDFQLLKDAVDKLASEPISDEAVEAGKAS